MPFLDNESPFSVSAGSGTGASLRETALTLQRGNLRQKLELLPFAMRNLADNRIASSGLSAVRALLSGVEQGKITAQHVGYVQSAASEFNKAYSSQFGRDPGLGLSAPAPQAPTAAPIDTSPAAVDTLLQEVKDLSAKVELTSEADKLSGDSVASRMADVRQDEVRKLRVRSISRLFSSQSFGTTPSSVLSLRRQTLTGDK